MLADLPSLYNRLDRSERNLTHLVMDTVFSASDEQLGWLLC